MPIVRIAVSNLLGEQDIRTVSDAVHDALVKIFAIPDEDRFHLITRHAASEMICTGEFLGIRHTNRMVFVQITCRRGRTPDLKRALYQQIARGIGDGGAARPEDVVINLAEVESEDASFGAGV